MTRQNPLDQMRALRARRAAARADQLRAVPPRAAEDTRRFTEGDTQPIYFVEEVMEPAPARRGRRRLVIGLAAGAVAGTALAFSLPALADNGSTPPAARSAAVSGSGAHRAVATSTSSPSGPTTTASDAADPAAGATPVPGAAGAPAPAPGAAGASCAPPTGKAPKAPKPPKTAAGPNGATPPAPPAPPAPPSVGALAAAPAPVTGGAGSGGTGSTETQTPGPS